MSVLYLLVSTSLVFGLVGLGDFIWSLRTRQYEDLADAAHRVLEDDELEPDVSSERPPTERRECRCI